MVNERGGGGGGYIVPSTYMVLSTECPRSEGMEMIQVLGYVLDNKTNGIYHI